jgi:hypothetical protein
MMRIADAMQEPLQSGLTSTCKREQTENMRVKEKSF